VEWEGGGIASDAERQREERSREARGNVRRRLSVVCVEGRMVAAEASGEVKVGRKFAREREKEECREGRERAWCGEVRGRGTGLRKVWSCEGFRAESEAAKNIERAGDEKIFISYIHEIYLFIFFFFEERSVGLFIRFNFIC
jgi:hypothetical protein